MISRILMTCSSRSVDRGSISKQDRGSMFEPQSFCDLDRFLGDGHPLTGTGMRSVSKGPGHRIFTKGVVQVQLIAKEKDPTLWEERYTFPEGLLGNRQA